MIGSEPIITSILSFPFLVKYAKQKKAVLRHIGDFVFYIRGSGVNTVQPETCNLRISVVGPVKAKVVKGTNDIIFSGVAEVRNTSPIPVDRVQVRVFTSRDRYFQTAADTAQTQFLAKGLPAQKPDKSAKGKKVKFKFQFSPVGFWNTPRHAFVDVQPLSTPEVDLQNNRVRISLPIDPLQL